MAWGTDFKANVYLSRITFTSIYQVEDKIKELEDEINTAREILSMLAIASPNTIIEQDEDPIYSIKNRVEDQVNIIIEAQYTLVLVNLYYDELKEGRITLDKEIV